MYIADRINQCNDMINTLYKAGFKRIDTWEWYYIHADNKRFIKIAVLDSGLVEVNFNDESIVRQEPRLVTLGASIFANI